MNAKNSQPKNEITMDYLARIVQEGLLGVKESLDAVEGRLETIETDVAVLKSDVAELKSDMKDVKANLNKKVDKVDHNTLMYQVEKLEKKFA